MHWLISYVYLVAVEYAPVIWPIHRTPSGTWEFNLTGKSLIVASPLGDCVPSAEGSQEKWKFGVQTWPWEGLWSGWLAFLEGDFASLWVSSLFWQMWDFILFFHTWIRNILPIKCESSLRYHDFLNGSYLSIRVWASTLILGTIVSLEGVTFLRIQVSVNKSLTFQNKRIWTIY